MCGCTMHYGPGSLWIKPVEVSLGLSWNVWDRRVGTGRTQVRKTWPAATEIDLLASGLVAGPVTTLPSWALNRLPWHGQSIVPSAAWSTMHRAWVQTAGNARYFPAGALVAARGHRPPVAGGPPGGGRGGAAAAAGGHRGGQAHQTGSGQPAPDQQSAAGGLWGGGGGLGPRGPPRPVVG